MRWSLPREPAPAGHGRARRGGERAGIVGRVRARALPPAVAGGARALAGAEGGAALRRLALAAPVRGAQRVDDGDARVSTAGAGAAPRRRAAAPGAAPARLHRRHAGADPPFG